ncbi:MAG TPA: chemotaxis protein CheC [Clostridiaceae bacterium]|jgi:chemotaxis protein CheC|nr:chemotaxis protein CheC [Clostridiaceae bacterium]
MQASVILGGKQVVINKFDSNDIDILTEIGNIGAGNAATALSEILQGRVDMSVPKVGILKFKELINELNGPENIIVAILVEVSGDLDGFILFALETECALTLLRLVGMEYGKDVFSLSELEMSTLTEITNILTGTYLTAVCDLTGLAINATVPSFAIDMAGAILNVPISFYGRVGDSVLLIETQFKSGDDLVIGRFMLIPDVSSYKTLLKSLRNGEK